MSNTGNRKKAATVKREPVSTTLSRSEMRQFREARRFVLAYCGFTSNAETLRYLVRNWSAENSWKRKRAGGSKP